MSELKERSGAELYFKIQKEISNKQEYSIGRPVYGRWKYKERQIWLYWVHWKPEFQNPEYLMWIINHEFLHSTIDDFLEEDDLYDDAWREFPFMCGLDEMFGISSFDTHLLPFVREKGSFYVVISNTEKQFFPLELVNKILKYTNGFSWKHVYPHS